MVLREDKANLELLHMTGKLVSRHSCIQPLIAYPIIVESISYSSTHCGTHPAGEWSALRAIQGSLDVCDVGVIHDDFESFRRSFRELHHFFPHRADHMRCEIFHV